MTDIFELVKQHQTITGTCDMIAEGGATCEGLARLVKDLWGRKPQVPGDEDGKVMRTAVVIWCCNDTATWGMAKGGKLLQARAPTPAMRSSAVDLRNLLKRYDGGVIIGPASARTWGLESSWETGAEELARIIKPQHFHFWKSDIF